MKDIAPIVKSNAAHFRDELRNARNRAIDDAEDFDDILFALEKLGCCLHGGIESLGVYSGRLNSLAGNSPLGRRIPAIHSDWHSPAVRLLEIVLRARNDAMHQGAYARHLTTAAIEITIILEDALMTGANTVGELMVRNPVCAFPWQPVSFIRQEMLAHSYSFLPVYFLKAGGWKLVSDWEIAKFLRRPNVDREKELISSLEDAVSNGLTLIAPLLYFATESIQHVVARMDSAPVLICRKHDGQPEISNSEGLIGILSPFDLL